MTDREVALIVGVGPGLGSALARAAAAAGMDVALAARTPGDLAGIVHDVNQAGGRGLAYDSDASREADVESLFRRVGNDLGRPHLVIYNAGIYVPGGILEIRAADFERTWRVCCLGGFLVGREAARQMSARLAEGGAGGTIIFTGATASLRGSARFASLAAGKFGLRAVAQSMARELGPQGIHVAHVIIDGMIGSARAGFATDTDGRLDPDAIAANYMMLHRQSRSAWSHELDLRPSNERF